MREAVIVDAIRTPFGKHRGALKSVRPDDLAAHVIKTIIDRNKLDGQLVEDVILGCANQAGEDNRNVARMAALLAGLPETVPGVTVNRLCASGLEAINQAARAILAGEGDVFIAGGVESMSRAPLVMQKPEEDYVRGNQTMWDTTLGWRMVNPKLAAMYHPFSMGETAENVAQRYSISRQEQDEYAVLSQQRAKNAHERGYLQDEIVPVSVRRGREMVLVETDEHPRFDATIEQLSALKPAFREGGTVTAGNASGINDGASAVLVMSRSKAEELGLRPLLRYVASGTSGVDPAVMGIGPVEAIQKAVRRASIRLQDVTTVEINEAFAAQTLGCIKELGLSVDIVNPNGGAIALGHPLGASGSRLVGALARELGRSGGKYGVTSLCVGVGQGLATIWENLQY